MGETQRLLKAVDSSVQRREVSVEAVKEVLDAVRAAAVGWGPTEQAALRLCLSENLLFTAKKKVGDDAATELCRLLLEAGADVNGAGLDEPPLARAARAERDQGAPLVRLLIEAGADVDATDKHGWTAAHLAALASNKDVVRMLIDAGANLRLQCGGRTPAEVAVRSDEVRELIESTTPAPLHRLRILGQGAYSSARLAEFRNLLAESLGLAQGDEKEKRKLVAVLKRILADSAAKPDLVAVVHDVIEAGANVRDPATSRDDPPITIAVRARTGSHLRHWCELAPMLTWLPEIPKISANQRHLSWFP
jgi:ankyrin repeat protein